MQALINDLKKKIASKYDELFYKMVNKGYFFGKDTEFYFDDDRGFGYQVKDKNGGYIGMNDWELMMIVEEINKLANELSNAICDEEPEHCVNAKLAFEQALKEEDDIDDPYMEISESAGDDLL